MRLTLKKNFFEMTDNMISEPLFNTYKIYRMANLRGIIWRLLNFFLVNPLHS